MNHVIRKTCLRMGGLVPLLVFLVAIGCSGKKVTTQASSELPRYQIRTLALMPFTTMSTPQVTDNLDMYLSSPQSVRRSDISLGVPLAGEPSIRQTLSVPEHAAEKITQLFWSRLKDRKQVVVFSPSQVAKTFLKARPDEGKVTVESKAAAVAKALKVDAALLGQVLVYQERVGGKLGANPPASVGFEIKAVAADGLVLWVGNYYERQKPMTQDFMGFVQHGGVFVTAEDLAAYGVDAVLKEFPFGAAED